MIQEALVDPLLSRYSVIIIDEAHERSISTDILLGLLKKIIRKRPELRVVISSATIQTEEILKFFTSKEGGRDSVQPSAAIISVEGRLHPIDILYLENTVENYLEKAVQTVIEIHSQEGHGDILIFLTGREEIEAAIDAVMKKSTRFPPGSPLLQPMALYAGLPSDQQQSVLEKAPDNARKAIFSTNVAEASITIEGIAFVIDCGFVKLRAFDPRTGIESLTVTPVSKASAAQRAGRAGRTRPGKCFRLYTEEYHDTLPESNVPEVQRSNLAPFILQMKALGIDNVLRFNYLTPPPSELMINALEVLYSLGALDEYAKLTKPLGLRMAELAVGPMMAKALLSAKSFGCLSEIITIAAMISIDGSVWFHDEEEKMRMETVRRKFAAEEGDHLTLLNVYHAFDNAGKNRARFCKDHLLNYKAMCQAITIRAQLKRCIERFGTAVDKRMSAARSDFVKGEAIRRCLTTGYFAHAAKMQPDGTFRAVGRNTILYAHPSNLMFNRKADWVIFHEAVETGAKIFIRDITKIEKRWLLEYAPEFYTLKSQ